MLFLLTLGYLGVVAWVTLGPQPLDAGGSRILYRALRFFGDHHLTSWITYDRVEFTANIAMFVPIGLLFVLVLGRKRWWLAMLIGIALTVTIELSQLGIPGRVSDPRDVLSNSLGVVIALLVTIPRRGSRPTTRPVPLTGP